MKNGAICTRNRNRYPPCCWTPQSAHSQRNKEFLSINYSTCPSHACAHVIQRALFVSISISYITLGLRVSTSFHQDLHNIGVTPDRGPHERCGAMLSISRVIDRHHCIEKEQSKDTAQGEEEEKKMKTRNWLVSEEYMMRQRQEYVCVDKEVTGYTKLDARTGAKYFF